jgi:hypothetical protein
MTVTRKLTAILPADVDLDVVGARLRASSKPTTLTVKS